MVSLDATSMIADSSLRDEIKDGSITVAAAPEKPKGAVKKRRSNR